MEPSASDAWFSAAGWPAHPVRVQLVGDAHTLSCLLSSISNPYLVLELGPGSPSKCALGSGDRVTVRVSHQGRCLEAETRVRQWIWSRTPQVVVGPIHAWRESGERAAPRLPQVAGARLELEDGRVLLGRTRDVSASGALLDLSGAGPEVGATARLTLELDGEFWCEAQPVQVARVRHRLGSGGRIAEVAVRLEARGTDDVHGWTGWIARIHSAGEQR